jgi:photosystem II stability/assembly factor-like uncharacterized protein
MFSSARLTRVLVLASFGTGLLAGATLERRPAVGAFGAPVPAQATAVPTSVFWTPGGTWRALHGPNTSPLWPNDPPVLRAVSGTWTDAGAWIGWAVGEKGAIARYDGAKWSVIKDFDPRQMPLTYTFNDVFVVTPDDVWIVGKVEGDRACEGCGTIVHWDGRRFVVPDRLTYGVNGKMGGLNAIDMRVEPDGSRYGWIVGDDADFDRWKAMILRYTPAEGWDVWQSNNMTRNLYDVRLVSKDEAWAVGGGGVELWYHLANGEGLWYSYGVSGSDALYAVDLADQLDGWDGGFRGRMNKYRGHCHDEDPATQCWFQNEAIPLYTQGGAVWNLTIYDLDLLSRTQGWVVGTVSGRTSTVAYLSAPDRWTLVRVEADPGRTLYGMAMASPALGYAVGDDGVILEYRDVSTPTATASPIPPTVASRTATSTPIPSDTPTSAVPTDLPATTAPPPSSATAGATDVPTDTPTDAPPPDTGTAPPTDPPTVTPSQPAGRVYCPLVVRRG